ncbi:hypothetical protein [Bulleidia sp. zg-1006]|uniref:hypothetical protein n=1 Tax=Bulleidia sp. zg-1006 TaxID=2806552 RepID=UPI0019395B25|nr:hypothetical protein [Bulleidia sp. zg-1006]QRG87237.1 hypothetical protein JOS54_02710 [Bulleidia sp. zg-1006]
MEKVMSREVDLDELESLALVGGNDGGTVNPQSFKVTIITILVTCLSITQTASAKEICG